MTRSHTRTPYKDAVSWPANWWSAMESIHRPSCTFGMDRVQMHRQRRRRSNLPPILAPIDHLPILDTHSLFPKTKRLYPEYSYNTHARSLSQSNLISFITCLCVLKTNENNTCRVQDADDREDALKLCVIQAYNLEVCPWLRAAMGDCITRSSFL